jgi:hypothetical protein
MRKVYLQATDEVEINRCVSMLQAIAFYFSHQASWRGCFHLIQSHPTCRQTGNGNFGPNLITSRLPWVVFTFHAANNNFSFHATQLNEPCCSYARLAALRHHQTQFTKVAVERESKRASENITLGNIETTARNLPHNKPRERILIARPSCSRRK